MNVLQLRASTPVRAQIQLPENRFPLTLMSVIALRDGTATTARFTLTCAHLNLARMVPSVLILRQSHRETHMPAFA